MSEEDTPQELLLQRAMPHMAKVVADGFKAQQDMIRSLIIQNEQLKTQLADIATGRAPVPVRVTVDFAGGHTNVIRTDDQQTTPMDLDSSPAIPSTTIDTFSTTLNINSQEQQQQHLCQQQSLIHGAEAL